jgi:hypothetical protein
MLTLGIEMLRLSFSYPFSVLFFRSEGELQGVLLPFKRNA